MLHGLGDTLIGFAIGGEGIFSSLIPSGWGCMSDRIWTKRWGRRAAVHDLRGALHGRLLDAGAVPAGLRAHRRVDVRLLRRLPFLHSPYQSLLPDVTPAGQPRKVQGYQSFMRGGGMFLGMVVAGVLFYRWEPLPFILCGVLIMVFTYLTVVKIHEPEPERSLLPPRAGHLGRDEARAGQSVRQNKRIRRFMVAASCGSRPWQVCGLSSCCYFINTLGSSTQMGGAPAGPGRGDLHGGRHRERLPGRQVRPVRGSCA